MILLSVLILMLESVKSYDSVYGAWLDALTNIIMPIFVVEYLLRIYAIGIDKRYAGVLGRVKYIKTPYAIVDLLSILPFLASGLNLNTSFIRSLRLLRIFRLLRMKKSNVFLIKIKDICLSKKEDFSVLLFFILISLVILSFVMFRFEHEAQPEVFSNIFETLWWAVATLTTVGYGDMYPITATGKAITSFISIIGIAFVAIPGGIFASEFINHVSKAKNKCPTCGGEDVKIINDIIIQANDKTLKRRSLNQCKSCRFEWVKN